MSDTPVPINYVPRMVKSERPVAAVTQAVGLVRQPAAVRRTGAVADQRRISHQQGGRGKRPASGVEAG